MHELDGCGELSGTIKQLAVLGRCTPTEVEAAIDELSESESATVTFHNKKITLINRRMAKEYKRRKSNTNRQKRYRNKSQPEDNKTEVTEKSRSPSSSSSSSSKNTGTGTSGVLHLVDQEMLADPARVLEWFGKASNGKSPILTPTMASKINVVALAQRVLRDVKVKDPVKVFVANVRDKNFKVTNVEEDGAIAAIKLIERGPPGKRTSNLSSRSKSKEQQLRELKASNLGDAL